MKPWVSILSFFICMGLLSFFFSRWPGLGTAGAEMLVFFIPALIGIFIFLPKPYSILKGESVTGREIIQVAITILGLSFISTLGSNLLELVFPMPEAYKKLFEELAARISLGDPRVIVSVAIVPALAEEFFFRGYLQNVFMRKWSPMASIGLSTLFFAVAHANPWQLVFYLLLGGYLGWMQLRYQNIWLNVWAHALNNLLALGLLAAQRAAM